MQRTIKTKRSIRRTRDNKILYRIGEGSGGGPAVWLAHLVVMFNLMSTIALIPTLWTPTRKIKHSAPGTGFVDDCNLLALSEADESDPTRVTKNIQENAQQWEEYLYTNGGKLELTKCYWSIVVWIWCRGLAKIAKDEDVTAELRLRQSQSKSKRRIKIQRKNNTDAGKVLDVHMNMRGTWKIDADRWIGISKTFHKK